MNSRRGKGWRCWIAGALACAGCHAVAQLPEQVFTSSYQIDSLQENKLFFTVDNLSFFKNNEWVTAIIPGYTLPGVWLQPKFVYSPLKDIRLEAGVHSLWFWGTNRYPSYAYSQLPYWNGENRAYVVHVLPWIRAQVALSSRVQLVLGNLYGGACHSLSEPLYNPELNLTADPEAGVQLLFNAPCITLDTWVNWVKFIYRSDVKQEALVYGLSVRMKANRPESQFHIYFPVQAIAQHQGGQIDVTDLPVQTVLNGAAGIGADWRLHCGALKRIHAEWLMAGYYQHAGSRWPLKQGYGNYAVLSADLAAFHVKAAYWQCDRFISILGNPLFGAPSMSATNAFFEHPKMCILGASYTRSFGHGLTLGIDAELYQRFAAKLNDPVSGVAAVSAKSNYSFGVYFRVTPSFLLKSF